MKAAKAAVKRKNPAIRWSKRCKRKITLKFIRVFTPTQSNVTLFYCRLGFPGLGAFMGKTAEEMQRAVDIYQSELAKLQQRAMLAAAAAAGTKEEAASPVDDLSDDGKRKDENNDVENEGGKKEGDVNFKQSGHPSLGSLPPPGTAFFTTSANNNSMSSTSPLQSMASITNSLTAHPIPPPVYRPNQRSFKAILPPITQDQFDRCDNINTEELVLRVSSHLQYSAWTLINVKRYSSDKGGSVTILHQSKTLRREHLGLVSRQRVRLVGQAQTVSHVDAKGQRAVHPDENVFGGRSSRA